MSKSVESTRGELFEAWSITSAWLGADEEDMQRTPSDGGYQGLEVHSAWVGFNAALDSIDIHFPSSRGLISYDSFVSVRDECRAAIELTNLGIKVK